jgi:diguanylate cyclase (GGDEF)-like protein/PAS domain S-box-containing protein
MTLTPQSHTPQIRIEPQPEELLRAMDHLELSRESYGDLFEFAPAAYLVLSAEGVVVEVNRAGLALLGLDRRSVLRQPFAQFVAAGDLQFWSKRLGALLKPESRLNLEINLLRGDGSRFCAQLDGLCLKAGESLPLVLVVLTDIAARKRAETALREQEKFFRLIAENLGDFIAVLDLEGRRIYNSPSYRRLFGEATDLSGTDSFAEIHEDDRPRVKELFRETVRTGIGRQTDYRFVLGDGSIRDMESVGAVIRDNAGRVARVVVVARDVTERKQTEQQLQIAAAAFEAHVGILVTDADGVIQRVNPAFSVLTGYSAAESIGHTPKLLSSGRHDAEFYAAMWESIRSRGTWQGEIWNRRKSGQVYPQWLTITAVRNNHGAATTHYVATMADISERKAVEDQIRHLALYDDLTQLPNRRLLLDRLQKALAASARSGRRGALLLIDLDKFKELNDTYGHDHGDALLQQVARRLSSCIREVDTAARFGGDEFIVMLTDLSQDPIDAKNQATAVAEKILATLNNPYTVLGKEHVSTSSVGVTLFADQRTSVDEVLKQADLAMYQAKAAGRNVMRFFDPAAPV